MKTLISILTAAFVATSILGTALAEDRKAGTDVRLTESDVKKLKALLSDLPKEAYTLELVEPGKAKPSRLGSAAMRDLKAENTFRTPIQKGDAAAAWKITITVTTSSKLKVDAAKVKEINQFLNQRRLR